MAGPNGPSASPSRSASGNGRAVAGLLLVIALLPLIALAVTFPEMAGPPVAAFLLTGVGVFAYRRVQSRRRR